MTRARRALVLVNGDDTHHDLIAAAEVFRQLGTEADLITHRGMGLNRFREPRPPTVGADTYLLYTAGGVFPTAQQEALAAAVSAGRGLVGVHGANILRWSGDALDPADRPLFQLLGNRYLSHGPGHHEGRHRIHLTAEHPVTAGLADFELFDEYYEFEPADDHMTVLANRRREQDGALIPVAYAREVGAGRVVYIALGHDMRAWGEPAFRQLIRQALRWTARADEVDA